MIEINPEKIIKKFAELTHGYAEKPDLMTGLSLDDVSARLMSASGYIFKNNRPHGLLHDFRKLVRSSHAESNLLYLDIKHEL